MSIESHLVSLRNYLEQISSQNQEIISLLKARGEQPYPAQATTDAFLAAVTQDVLSKPQSVAAVEKQLEAETGKDFVKTGNSPVTLAESDKPAKTTAKKGK